MRALQAPWRNHLGPVERAWGWRGHGGGCCALTSSLPDCTWAKLGGGPLSSALLAEPKKTTSDSVSITKNSLTHWLASFGDTPFFTLSPDTRHRRLVSGEPLSCCLARPPTASPAYDRSSLVRAHSSPSALGATHNTWSRRRCSSFPNIGLRGSTWSTPVLPSGTPRTRGR